MARAALQRAWGVGRCVAATATVRAGITLAMRQRLARVVKWAGLLLCLGLGAAWVGSGWFNAGVRVPSGGGLVWFDVGEGCGFLTFESPRPARRQRLVWLPHPAMWRWWTLDRTTPSGAGTNLRIIAVPLWMLLLPLAAIATRCWMLDRPRRPGHCPRCSYNLRGLSADSPCPECGSGGIETETRVAAGLVAADGVGRER